MGDQSECLDINSSDFNCESYLNELLRKNSLDELVQIEEEMVHHVRRLDSEMQQLVYENYNKFLTATGTVKKMQNDFMQMKREIDGLSQRMGRITSLSKELSSSFGKHRASVSDLANANKKVKKLQFLLGLPQQLRNLVESKKLDEAVKIFLLARTSLLRYKDVPALADIYVETTQVVKIIEEQLYEVIARGIVSSDELSEAVTLLLKLGIESVTVQKAFISSCRSILNEQLTALESNKEGVVDVLEFIDKCCSTFLTDLSLASALNQRLFTNQVAQCEVMEMIEGLMNRFEKAVRSRFLEETDARDCAIVVRAMDRFYRRMSSCNQLVSGVDCLPICISMLNAVSHHEIALARSRVVERISSSLYQVGEELSTPNASASSSSMLNEVISRLEHTLLVQLKTALASLLLFTASDMTFSSLDASQFSLGFGIDVHEMLLVKSLEEVSAIGNSFCEPQNKTSSNNPIILIVLAQFFCHVENHSVPYILDLCQEQFRLVREREKGKKSRLSTAEKVRFIMRNAAYDLLKEYVYHQGINTSQLLVRAIDSRDWLNCPEPSAVRAPIKHFIDELVVIDSAIKPIMDEGTRKERVLESSSARSLSRRGNNFETSSISSTIDKLWSERVDICSKIEFNRLSVLTALIHISLKSYLECIRLQTFSKFGLQQIQVDCYFLRQNLWRYLSDEQVALSLLDEAVSSAVHRSTEQKLLEPSTVKAIYARQTA